MKRLLITIVCLNVFACLDAQGITLLYKNNAGWYDPISWVQINTPSGQMPIQRVPTADDDVVISSSMSGISSVTFQTDDINPDFNVGGAGPNGPSRCKSMHISNTEITFDYPILNDAAPTINVYTSGGGFVIIDSSSNVLHGHIQLHGGNPAITDLQILHSIYGILFSHANWTDISWDAGARLKFVGSTLAGYDFSGGNGANVFIDSSNIQTNNFRIGDSSTATLTNSTVTDNINNNSLTFFIGKNSNFVSVNDTVSTFYYLGFTTSGLQLNGNVGAFGGSSEFVFLQEDPANPLPNIINGNLYTRELNLGMGISGNLKISGNVSGFPDDAYNNPVPVLVNGKKVFNEAGITNYGSSAFINNCVQDFCHYKLEFFGSTNSDISWNTGFPVDTLIINKTGCAKVTIDSSLYVSGATRIEGGQLVLNPNDNIPYKFVCAGNVDIAVGGGLFLRRDAAGVVANMAIGGTLVDHNPSPDSTCAGVSNFYNGTITFYSPVLPLTLIDFYGRYSNKNVILNWSTEREIDTKYFTIEKSLDQVSFVPLTNITASGNTHTNDYQYTDRSSLNRINYYRLKMMDADGRFSYSKIIAISAPVNNAIIVFPNPVKDKLFIRLAGISGPTEISIADARGTVIKQLQLRAGTFETSVSTAGLTAGVYSISFQSGTLKSTQQFIKQ